MTKKWQTTNQPLNPDNQQDIHKQETEAAVLMLLCYISFQII